MNWSFMNHNYESTRESMVIQVVHPIIIMSWSFMNHYLTAAVTTNSTVLAAEAICFFLFFFIDSFHELMISHL